MTKGRNIKEAIEEEAFRLFLSKPYDKVTYTDLEKATGFSRGAILYHFRTKLSLLERVTDKYLFHDDAIFDFYNEAIGMSFLSFIHIYCDWVENEKRKIRKLSVCNYNLSMVNITMQAFYFNPGMKDRAARFGAKEKEAWRNILKKGVGTGELREDTDVLLIAGIIQGLYYGVSHTGMVRDDGTDISLLKEQLLHIYAAIKA
jgi:AcrR family transcriptional regulator